MTQPGTSPPARSGRDGPLLEVENLRTRMYTEDGAIDAIDGISFAVDPGETVCLVGESGSGKSVTCDSLTRLHTPESGAIVDGSVVFDGVDLVDASNRTLRSIRGTRIAHVFQEPRQSLDPVYTVGAQIREPIEIHRMLDGAAARERSIDLLRQVGISRPTERLDAYPHELSTGMCQRVALAVALAADPDLLVADEPTTALDVTHQARLIDLLKSVGREQAVLWVTHDLRVVAQVADRVLVMFGGTIVERGPVERVFASPGHPYTQELFASFEGTGGESAWSPRPDLPTDGCRFRDQCPHAIDACATPEQPPFHPVRGYADHRASCVYHGVEHSDSVVMGNSDWRGSTPDHASDTPSGGGNA